MTRWHVKDWRFTIEGSAPAYVTAMTNEADDESTPPLRWGPFPSLHDAMDATAAVAHYLSPDEDEATRCTILCALDDGHDGPCMTEDEAATYTKVTP